MRVPIFPLNLVLFPGQALPLHIFEERYKQMLQRCLRERIPFGIVLIRESGRISRGSPHSVGTFARVTQVDEIPEGQCTVPAPHRGSCYHIVCRGDERFRVTALDRREAEYLVADVELFPDEPAPPPALMMVAQRVSTLFDEYYRNVIALMGGWQREAGPGEQTLLVDMTTLVAGLNSRGEAEPEQAPDRTVAVPALPTDPIGAGKRRRGGDERHAAGQAGPAGDAVGAGAPAARGGDPGGRDAADGGAPQAAAATPLLRVRDEQLGCASSSAAVQACSAGPSCRCCATPATKRSRRRTASSTSTTRPRCALR